MCAPIGKVASYALGGLPGLAAKSMLGGNKKKKELRSLRAENAQLNAQNAANSPSLQAARGSVIPNSPFSPTDFNAR